jgi:hypothetical protein
MGALVRSLPVNGRMLIKMKEQEEPYCIVRVIHMDESVAGRSCELYLSLRKRSYVLKVGETIMLDLKRIPIEVKFVGFRWKKVELKFTADETLIDLKELPKRPPKPE